MFSERTEESNTFFNEATEEHFRVTLQVVVIIFLDVLIAGFTALPLRPLLPLALESLMSLRNKSTL